MKTTLLRTLERAQKQFGALALAQKTIVLVGIAALALAGFMVFRWTSAPTYAPLFTNLAPADASAIVEKLDASGVTYKLENGGATITVPAEQVYKTRISLSGEGLPASGASGYSLLDKQSLSTSQFQEQTSYKRAMEGELAKTIQAIDGVDGAIVHLAIPTKRVFSSEQDPTTASVLVKTRPGKTLGEDQVQAIVNLVASSIDGLGPDHVTVADATGVVLSAPADSATARTNQQDKQATAFETRTQTSLQEMLDQVLGAGNSKANVTAVLNFDKTSTKKVEYSSKTPPTQPLSEATTTEKYSGTGNGTTGGVVGPDGQLTPGANGTATPNAYEKSSKTADNAVDKTEQVTESAPGQVNSLHVGVVVDSAALGKINLTEVQDLVSSSLGIDATRGDTVKVSAMPFDRTTQKEAAAEFAAQAKVEKKAQQMQLIRTGATSGAVVLIGLVFWFSWRRRNKARAAARDFMVDTLRSANTPAEPVAAPSPVAAVAALEEADDDLARGMRDEITAMVEKQPEDVALLLRTWITEAGA